MLQVLSVENIHFPVNFDFCFGNCPHTNKQTDNAGFVFKKTVHSTGICILNIRTRYSSVVLFLQHLFSDLFCYDFQAFYPMEKTHEIKKGDTLVRLNPNPALGDFLFHITLFLNKIDFYLHVHFILHYPLQVARCTYDSRGHNIHKVVHMG